MSMPGKRSRWWLVLVVLLLGTVAGANWFFYFRPFERPVGPMHSWDVVRAEGSALVVCFGHVDVEYGIQSLNPLQPGRVVEVAVREYALVQAGEVLLRLDDRQARNLLGEAQAD